MRHSDISRGRVIIERWRVLAEARLDYLTELYESGRWRRYFSEQAFVENIREAKTSVETWRTLASQQALPDNTPLDLSWLDAKRPVPVPQPRMIGAQEPPPRVPSFVTQVTATAPMTLPVRSEIHVASVESPVAPPAPVAAPVPSSPMEWMRGLDLATLKQRYSLLRNAV